MLNYNLDKVTSPGMRLIPKPYKNTVSSLGVLVQKKVSLKSYKYDFIGIEAWALSVHTYSLIRFFNTKL